jgi:hypothetical protein
LRATGSGLPAFDNTLTGILRKSAGSGTARISVFALDNEGTIEPASGTLHLPDNQEISAGTVRLAGGAIEANGTFLFSGGRLEGSGIYRGSEFVGGIISPGVNGAGRITFPSGLAIGENVVLTVDASGNTPATEYDQLVVTGGVSITNSTLSFVPTASLAIGTELLVIQNDGSDSIDGTFDSFNDGKLFDVNQELFRTWYAEGSGNDFVIERSAEGVQLTGIQINPEGGFVLSGLGTNSVSYTLFAAPEVPYNDWEEIGTVTTDESGMFEFTDPDAHLFDMRFYQTLGPLD